MQLATAACTRKTGFLSKNRIAQAFLCHTSGDPVKHEIRKNTVIQFKGDTTKKELLDLPGIKK
jgi:hypothetical protein